MKESKWGRPSDQRGHQGGRHGGRQGHKSGGCGPNGDLEGVVERDDHHDHSHGRGHHRRHGRHRIIDSGELQLLLMRLLEETSRHGYDLIREIEAMTGGAYAPSPGMVYPTLTLLQEMDMIAELESDGPRKAFILTDQGQAEAAAKTQDMDQIVARLSAMRATQDRVDGGPVRRAVDNLRRVIRSRLISDDVDKEMLHTVAGILDETAQRIERL